MAHFYNKFYELCVCNYDFNQNEKSLAAHRLRNTGLGDQEVSFRDPPVEKQNFR